MTDLPIYSEEALLALRAEVEQRLSPYRFTHTKAVEEMIIRLGEIYLPEAIPFLRASAILHDLTKEYSKEDHEILLRSGGILPTEGETVSSKLYHAFTAALCIPEEFPEFAHPALLSAIFYHTTGHQGMAMHEKLLYLADYIDESRSFPDCVRVRNYFWAEDPMHLESEEERIRHLDQTLLLSFDLTLELLKQEGEPISPLTAEARKDILFGLSVRENGRQGRL